MKRVYLSIICGLILSSCGTSMANKVEQTTLSVYKENKEFENQSAVMLSASVNVTDSVTGSDTPTDELSEKVSKIDNVIVSLFDDKSKFLDTFTLKKVEPTIKGEVLKFESGFRAVSPGNVTFKYVFNDANNKVFFESEGKTLIKAKSVVKINGQLDQVSAKKDPNAPETINVNINEMKEDSYTSGEIIIGMKDDIKEEDLKSQLEKNGIKTTELKKGILKTYTVKFSSPSVAEALIIANKIGRFEYAEPNGIVSIQF